MTYKSLFIGILFLLVVFVPFYAGAVDQQRRAVHIEGTSFEDSIIRLSEIFDIKIILKDINNLPHHKFDLALKQATVKEAAQEAIEKAGLQSHVLVVDEQAHTARIWILRAGTADTIRRLQPEHHMRSMTPEEFKALERVDSENFRGMTPEEYGRLEPGSKENFRGMTPGDFAGLEPAQSENFRKMTRQEYERMEPESEENLRGMTPEQFAQLP